MAERLVLSLYKKDREQATEFATSLTALHDLNLCTQCFNITDDQLCGICTDTNRDQSLLCIVEEPLDIIPIERSRAFTGLYHVLGGTTSGKDASNLTIPALTSRIASGDISEVIIATNFTTEGDTTAMYVQRLLSDEPVVISRLARGLATGSDIEYADDLTITSALQNRTSVL